MGTGHTRPVSEGNSLSVAHIRRFGPELQSGAESCALRPNYQWPVGRISEAGYYNEQLIGPLHPFIWTNDVNHSRKAIDS